MKCPRCGEAMHEIDAGLWTCICGASMRMDAPDRKREDEQPAPTVCMLDCPERKRCDCIKHPMRCATFRAVKVRHLRTIR